MDAFWEGRFEQQFTDDDIMWECCICRQPKVPYVTLVPCGHSLCKNCSTAVAKCPTCRKPVEKRTDGHELTQMVLSRIVYRCTTDGCSFRGTEREARDHICRVYRYRELGPHIPDDEFKTLVLQLPESAPDSDVLDEIQKAELRYNPPSPPVPAALEPPEAVVYWDYDNLPPRGVGATFESFLEGLHDALRANGIVVKHTAAYLVNGKDYGNDLERLGKALVSVQLCGTKREQADRNMSDDMRRRASELGKRGVFVIVSSDQDFNSDAQFLGLRHDVWVVHNAIPGSDHERLLGLSATGLLRVSEFVRPVTPPRYRGGLRTLSQEVTGTAQRRNRAPVPVPQATTLRIGQVDVPVSAVLRNEGFNLLENGTLATGKWCTKTTNHDPKTCTYMHVAPGYLNAEYMARPVTDFVANAGVEYLQSHPWVSGQWCLNESPHDPSTCRFLHPAPGVAHLYGLTLDDGAATVQSETPTLAPAAITVVFVDGAETPVEELVDNDALAYLRAHPRSNGRTCNNSSPTHDASKCKYVHRKAPAVTVLVDGIATPG